MISIWKFVGVSLISSEEPSIRKPIQLVSITNDTGKTAVLTHSHTLSEFITLNPFGKLKVLCRKYLGSLNVLMNSMYQV